MTKCCFYKNSCLVMTDSIIIIHNSLEEIKNNIKCFFVDIFMFYFFILPILYCYSNSTY